MTKEAQFRKLIKKIILESVSLDSEIKNEIVDLFKYFGEVTHEEIRDIAEKYNYDFERVAEIYSGVLMDEERKRKKEFVDAVIYTINEVRKNIGIGEDVTWDLFLKTWEREGYFEESLFENIPIKKIKEEFYKQTRDPNQLGLF
ncbi:MAG: hypothetical protein WC466_09295 [Candidatus Izemoplasmatales bacterium]